MNPYALPSIASLAPFLFLGLAALLQAPRRRAGWLLAAVCFAFVLESAAMALLHASVSYEQAARWNRWPYLVLLPAVWLTMAYVVEISGGRRRLAEGLAGAPVRWHLALATAMLALFWWAAGFTDLLLRPPAWFAPTGWEHRYGSWQPWFNAASVYVLALMAAILARGIAAAPGPVERTARKIALLALVGGLASAFVLGMVLPAAGVQTHSFVPLAFLFMCFFLTYGQMRRQWETVREFSQSLERKVAERTAELEASHQRLLEAQAQISRYLDPHVVEKIFSGQFQAELSHRRVRLTMFFSDIKDFTQFTDMADPELAAALLNEYLGEMAAIVRRWGGTIPQFTGDQIFAIFGAPDSRGHREDALACVRMALEMQARMAVLARQWWEQGVQEPFRIRCGIHTGMANVGNYGSEGFMEFSAIGLNTNLASRLEQACPPGEILVSHATWGLVGREVRCEPAGEVRVKGFHHPIQTYRVVEQSLPI
jgi:class 3 adenylate cyclase